MLPYAYSLTEPYSIIIAEYNAPIIGLQIAEGMGIAYLEDYGDLKLVINKVKGEYDVRNENLIPYHQATISSTKKFLGFFVNYVPWKDNTHADGLESLAFTLTLPPKMEQRISTAS